MSQLDIAVFWFRRDLRLEDNVGLSKALESGLPVLPVFIFDTNILDELPRNDARLSFIHETLHNIHLELIERNSALFCKKGNPLDCWKELIGSFRIKQVYFNKDYEPYARKRDEEIAEFLNANGIPCKTFKDQVYFEESEVVKQDGLPYTVFTPYKNKWLSQFTTSMKLPLTSHAGTFLKGDFEFPSLEDIGFERAVQKVRPYDLSVASNYAETRDIPSLDATSYLSPHLRFGTVGIRKIVSELSPDTTTILSELIWREFFKQILYHFPKVVNQNFRSDYDGVQWINNESDFERWKSGKTGYPMVDAGMRQLNQTGYMHNRVRMITAGFLCKHLLIDWRWGEAYFAEKLLDYELSSNNGNWQWSAGTGCDAAPYFRIFNPAEQLKKFDRNEVYVRHWIAEYGTENYPDPMVDHKIARQRAIDTYKMGLNRD